MAEFEASKERGSSGGGSPSTGQMTLQKAVELGEYKPEVLSQYGDWSLLSKHGQLQFIRTGLRYHKGQLMTQYAALFNIPNYSQKADELEPKLNHILDLVRQVDKDEEYYLANYV